MMTGKRGEKGGGGEEINQNESEGRMGVRLQNCQCLENENYMIWCCFRVFVHVLMHLYLNYLCECFLFFRFNE